MSGDCTQAAADGVRPNFLNLSIFRPDVFPQATTFLANSTVGMLMTQSLVFFSMSKLWFRLLMTQARTGGSKSIIMCHDMVIILARPPLAVVTITTGPGSIKR